MVVADGGAAEKVDDGHDDHRRGEGVEEGLAEGDTFMIGVREGDARVVEGEEAVEGVGCEDELEVTS